MSGQLPNLPAATSISGPDLFYATQSDLSRKATAAQILSYISSQLPPGTSGSFLALNYFGSRDPATNDTTAKATIEAAITANTVNGKSEIWLGPGTINISTLSASSPNDNIAIPNDTDVTIYLCDTRLIRGVYAVSGTSTYPSSFKDMFVMGKGSTVRLIGQGLAIIDGCRALCVANASIYSSYGWGAGLGGLQMRGIEIVNQSEYVFSYAEQAGATTEKTERQALQFLTAAVTGNGSNRVFTLDVLPVRSDNGAQKFQVGQAVILETAPNVGNRRDYFSGMIESIDVGALQITLNNAPPTGTDFLGAIATTASATALVGQNKVQLASVTGIVQNHVLDIVHDGGTVGEYWVERVSGSFVYLRAPLSLQVTSGNAVTHEGGRCLIVVPPAQITQRIDIEESKIHILPMSTAARLFNFTNSDSSYSILLECNLVNNQITGCLGFGILTAVGSHMRLFTKGYRDINTRWLNFGMQNAASGGQRLIQGFRTTEIRDATSEDEYIKDELRPTLAAAVPRGGQYIVVNEDLTAMIRLAGFTLSAGEKVPVSFTPKQTTSTLRTTCNGGALAGATTLPVLSTTNVIADDIITFTSSVGVEYNAIASVNAGVSFVLKYPLAGDVAGGANITEIASNNVSTTPASVNGIDTWRIVISEYSTNGMPIPDFNYHNIVAIDTRLGVGAHRIYTTTPVINGASISPQVLKIIDNNGIPGDGAEAQYWKGDNVALANYKSINPVQLQQGTIAAKGGNSYTNNSGGTDSLFSYGSGSFGEVVFVSNSTVMRDNLGYRDQRSGPVIWSQQTKMIVESNHFENGIITTHNATIQEDIIVRDNFLRGAPIILLQPGGGTSYLIEGNLYESWRDQIFIGTANYAFRAVLAQQGYSSAYENIRFINNRLNTIRSRGEGAGQTGACYRIDNQATNLYGDKALKNIFLDGSIGESNVCTAISIAGTGASVAVFGKITGMRIGSAWDMSGYLAAKSTLIKMSNVATIPATTLTSAALSGASQVEISDALTTNLGAGCMVKITLDSAAIHTTFLTKDCTTGSGILDIYDPLPSAAASGNAISIRPVGWIALDNPINVGYAAKERLRVAAGQTTVPWDIAGKFICYDTSPGSPLPESCDIKTLSGDTYGRDFLFGPPVIVANNTSQAGGSITWPMINPATGAAKALAADSTFVASFSEPFLRFNQ